MNRQQLCPLRVPQKFKWGTLFQNQKPYILLKLHHQTIIQKMKSIKSLQKIKSIKSRYTILKV